MKNIIVKDDTTAMREIIKQQYTTLPLIEGSIDPAEHQAVDLIIEKKKVKILAKPKLNYAIFQILK